MKNNNNRELNNSKSILTKICFLLILSLIILAGFCRTIFAPKDINLYENRLSNKIENLSINGFLNSTFQDSVEDSLADQIPFAQRIKSYYNNINSKIIIEVLKHEIENHPDKFYEYNNIYLKDGYIIWKTFDYEAYYDVICKTATSYNEAAKNNPNVDFYIYYTETDSVIDLRTNEKLPIFDDIKNICNELTVERFEINDLNDYEQYFFKTDHHWNSKGSYNAYKEILKMMQIDEEPLLPTYEIEIDYDYIGSKARESGLTNLSEKPIVYTFDYPDVGARIDYEDAILSGYLDYAYEFFYGGNTNETVYDTNRPDKKNILVIGDSMDNAIIKLIASHFNKTYSVDMRYMNEEDYANFYMKTYLEKNDIDIVLVVGSQVIFTSEQYIVEG